MKYLYMAASGVINFVLGIVFVMPGGFVYISVLYALEEVFGRVLDPTLEPGFFLGAVIFAILANLIYLPILILINVFFYKKLQIKKYIYSLFVVSFLVVGILAFIYYKLYIF